MRRAAILGVLALGGLLVIPTLLKAVLQTKHLMDPDVLAIARQLARASGGDLVLIDSDDGAVFELTLDAKPTGGSA